VRDKSTPRPLITFEQPVYSNFERNKSTSSLGGVYNPRAGSNAGLIHLLQGKEKDAVAYQTLQKKELPDWAFHCGLSEDGLRELTFRAAKENKKKMYLQQSSGRDDSKSSSNSKSNSNSNSNSNPPKKKRDRRLQEVLKSPIVVAMKNMAKKDPSPTPNPQILSTDDGDVRFSNNPKPTNLTPRPQTSQKTTTIRPNTSASSRPHTAASSSVRLSMSSSGQILSTINPEFAHLSTRRSQFFDVHNQTLTGTHRRPKSFATFGIQTQVFSQSDYEVQRQAQLDAENQNREKVYQNKLSLKESEAKNVLANIHAKETRREKLKKFRLLQQRQKKFLSALICLRFVGRGNAENFHDRDDDDDSDVQSLGSYASRSYVSSHTAVSKQNEKRNDSKLDILRRFRSLIKVPAQLEPFLTVHEDGEIERRPIRDLSLKLLECRYIKVVSDYQNFAANIIQRNYKLYFQSRMLKIVLAFRNLGLPFSLKVRIRRKHRSADLLKHFFYKMKSESGPQIVNNFMYQVRKGQTYVRQFLACRLARREVANLYFLKIEGEIRQRLIREERERELNAMNVLNEIPGIAETQYRFKAMKSKNSRLQNKTKRMMAEIRERDMKWEMKNQNRKYHLTQDVSKSDEDNNTTNIDDSSISSGSIFTQGSHYTITDANMGIHIPAIKARRGNPLARFIESDLRQKIVTKEVRKMRVNYLEETSGFVATALNKVIEEKDARKILETGKDAMINLRVISEEQMTTTVVERPKFMLFTGCYKGRTWRSLILSQVLADVEKQKEQQPKVVFRPAKTLLPNTS